MNIQKKLMLIGAALTVIPLLIVMLSFSGVMKNVESMATSNFRDQGIRNLDDIIGGVYKMCMVNDAKGGDTETLRRQISKIKVGETGYVFVIQGRGENQGAYIVSKDQSRDGENIWNAQDSNGVYFIQEICRKALNLRGGDIAQQQYPWKNAGDTKARMKVTRIAYYEPYDWAIGAGMYEDEFERVANEVKRRGNQAMIWIMLIGLAAVVVASVVWSFIAKQFSVKIANLVDVAKSIREGDISKRLDAKGSDELDELAKYQNEMSEALQVKVDLAETIANGDLTKEVTINSERDTFGKALQKMAASLHEMIHQAKMTVEQVAAGSGEVSAASQALSQGATSQAASMEEITSSVTELSSQTKTNAENATQANQLSKAAREAAGKGSTQMTEMQGAMSAIQTSSKDIEKIIKVIDDIAFQTNLLALNAAVEAARAGKHGKGFAVVAEEVRSLAGRSAKAAKETGELISDSMKKVENGNAVANATMEALAQIENSVTKVTDLVAEIAASSNEQAQGISQINQGLHQIDSVTQRNTSSAEETASAAEELSSQAAQLKQLLMGFKIRRMQGVAQPVVQRTHHIHSVEAAPAPVKPNGWGGGSRPVTVPGTAKPRPESVIALDDSEFGKY